MIETRFHLVVFETNRQLTPDEYTAIHKAIVDANDIRFGIPPFEIGESCYIIQSPAVSHQVGESIRSQLVIPDDILIVAEIRPSRLAICGAIDERLRRTLKPFPLCPGYSQGSES